VRSLVESLPRIAARARRPPRPVPRGPRERRALLRSEMPSIARRSSATARTEARTDRGALVEIWRSRDEDRPIPNEPSPFRPVRPLRLRARVNPLVARPPSTRLLLRTSFRPVRYRGRASLSPKTTYRLLQYDDVRAPTAGRLILDRGEGRRAPHLRSPHASSCEATWSNEPRHAVHPKTHVPRGPADPSEGLRAFRRASPLLDPTAHPSVVLARA
jgi:hypothetical protein